MRKETTTAALRKMFGWIIPLFVCTLLITACEEWFDDDEEDGDGIALGIRNFATGLDTPWEMVFAPDGRLFVTQRPGSIAVIDKSGKKKQWLALDSVQEIGESGLFGIELDPEFERNRYVYFAYTYAESKAPLVLVNKVVRYRDNNGTGVFDKVLLDGVPGNYLHNVGALEFGPDGMLYITSGETFKPELAQDMSSLNGKILRMTRDGDVPADNPFPGSYIYSLGHRNPQGLAFQPSTGSLWSTEHGPSEEQGCCMDEVNLIKAGANYGWPLIMGKQQQAGLETPVYYSGDTTTWAPTGGVFVRQGEWQGSLLFTGLRGEALYRAVFNASDPSKIDTVERYLYQKLGRLRNVTEGPDGRIYIAVSNQDGRGDPLSIDDRIVVLTQKQLKDFKSK
ncbi:PQQ-dependent sugar dehydrogenase [Chryseosolibacter indicus]|uniref:Sorbosone dehydrogenase family protein n=1 Tax=Chryseosolibacter indicus TaxID=2782351 RepID=A0ABS5VYE8_9BACT|nr:PQQ-dependent sugar dehydrogenase [Chryseosolibacter indicus]MBT1706088.1 sorbosone dehydrogenase family protein [Chryseosolibacter indicus]